MGALVGMAILALVAMPAAAQQTTVELKNGEVLSVQGNQLVVRTPEGVKNITVPDTLRINVDGQMLSVAELKPGMKLTAMITTTTKPVEMTATEVREAEVVHTMGSTIVIRNEKGELKKFTPQDMQNMNVVIYKNGKEVEPFALRKGDRITATIVTKLPPQTITETDLKVFGQAPPPPPAAPPAPQPQAVAKAAPPPPPAEPMPETLPKTASPLPAIGLAGALLLGAGLAVRSLRRRIAA
jgi:hypothetical protein